MCWRLTSVTILIICMVTHSVLPEVYDIEVYTGGGKVKDEHITEHIPHNVQVEMEDAMVNLTCPFRIENTVSPVEWFKENNSKLQPFDSGTGHFTMEFMSLNVTDSGTYACKVCSVHGCVFTYSELIVIAQSAKQSYFCNPSPCGSNAQCRDGICTCLPEYQGDPDTGCTQKCVWVSDCPSDKTCVRSRCIDPCPGSCGLSATCAVDNHVPTCSCPPTRTGNPFFYCSLLKDPVMTETCHPSTCGPFSRCQEINGQAMCSCMSEYIGTPPNCKANCDANSDCEGTEACKDWKCRDPCIGTCGIRTTCKVINHNPVCSCLPKYTGDPFVGCHPNYKAFYDSFKPTSYFTKYNAKFIEGRTEKLYCPHIKANNESSFQWFKEDKEQLRPYKNRRNLEFLTLENLSDVDSGMYACKVCIDVACFLIYFQLTVMKSTSTKKPHSLNTTYEETTTNKPGFNNGFSITKIIFAICGLVFLSGSFFVVFITLRGFCRKKKREKTRRRLAKELSLAAKLPRSTKRVIVERQTCAIDGHTPSGRSRTGIMVMPSVRIEKQIICKLDGQRPKYELPFDPDWEVPRDSLVIGEALGEGAFGQVMKAEATRLFQQKEITNVAVKMLKDNHTDNDLIQFVKEMELMKILGKHCHIIKLLGCCTQDVPLLVIMEFAPHGNLRDFLRKHRTCLRISKDCNCLTERDLVSFAYQVAKGMDYLASSKYIHGDLAARNVLVSENYVLKISDFGLARKLQQKDYYRKEINGLLPIKWMAPEFLFDNLYTTQSDVWSYGILLWEMMTLGGSPYPSVTSIGQLYKLLHHGYRMEKPSHCTQQMYTIMMECWRYRPIERPSFDKLVNIMNDMLAATTTLEYLEVCKPLSDSTPPVPGSSEEVELIVNCLPDAKLRKCFSRNTDIT